MPGSDADRIAALIEAGLTVGQTAHVVDATMYGLYRRIDRDASLKTMADAARAASDRPATRPHDWPVNIDDLLELLRHIASGSSLLQACEATSIPAPTLKRWRRTYPEVDAAVVAAALDGRKRPIRPIPTLACPGPRCGTGTGYDYGCAEDACRTAAAARAYRRRHPDPPGEPNHA